MIDIKFQFLYQERQTKTIHKRVWSIDEMANRCSPYSINELWGESDVIAKRMFSGFLDKNGVEIFDGDIIELINAFNEKIRVVCKYGSAERKIKGQKLNLCDIHGFYFETQDGTKTFPIVKNYLGKHDTEVFEVIGNIYEMNEL